MKIKYFIPSIIVMILIFLFSMQTGHESSTISHGIILWIEKHLNIIIPSLFIRKCAHMIEYAILNFTFIYAFKKNNIQHYLLHSLFLTFVYACSDEFHQTFIDGRSGHVVDIFIDTLGGMISTILYKIKTYK